MGESEKFTWNRKETMMSRIKGRERIRILGWWKYRIWLPRALPTSPPLAYTSVCASGRDVTNLSVTFRTRGIIFQHCHYYNYLQFHWRTKPTRKILLKTVTTRQQSLWEQGEAESGGGPGPGCSIWQRTVRFDENAGLAPRMRLRGKYEKLGLRLAPDWHLQLSRKFVSCDLNVRHPNVVVCGKERLFIR